MQTKPKANSVVTHVWDEAAQTLVFKVLGAGELTLEMGKLSPANASRAMRHGMIQRVVDSAAKARDTKTGLAVPVGEKFEAMRRLVEFYNSGSEEWTIPREGGAGGTGLDSVALAAVVEFTGKTRDEIRALLASTAEKRGITQKAALAALASSPKIAAIVNRIRGAAAGIDADELLGDMMAEDGEGEEG